MQTSTSACREVRDALRRGEAVLGNDKLEYDKQLVFPHRDLRTCPRGAWLRASAERKSVDGSNNVHRERNLRGHAFEKRIVHVLELGGMPVNCRQMSIYHRRVGKVPYVIGNVDGVVTINGEDYFIEIKTVNDRAFRTEVLRDGLEGKKSGGGDQHKQVLNYVDFGDKSLIAIVGNSSTDEIFVEEFSYSSERSTTMKRKLSAMLDAKRPEDIPDEFVSEGCRCAPCAEYRGRVGRLDVGPDSWLHDISASLRSIEALLTTLRHNVGR
ncbi:hypothetical protein NKDENANG_03473 [Candidatus Entotheonellaceae bacterium PAL068K]